jgi:hypothetical protein
MYKTLGIAASSLSAVVKADAPVCRQRQGAETFN